MYGTFIYISLILVSMFLCFIFLDISKKFETILLYDNIIFRNSKTGEHICFGNNVSFLKKILKKTTNYQQNYCYKIWGAYFSYWQVCCMILMLFTNCCIEINREVLYPFLFWHLFAESFSNFLHVILKGIFFFKQMIHVYEESNFHRNILVFLVLQ